MRPNRNNGLSARERANAVDSKWGERNEWRRKAAVPGFMPPADLECMSRAVQSAVPPVTGIDETGRAAVPGFMPPADPRWRWPEKQESSSTTVEVERTMACGRTSQADPILTVNPSKC